MSDFNFKANKAFYLYYNSCKIVVVVVVILVLLNTRLNPSLGFPTHENNCEENLVGFSYWYESEVQLKLHQLIFKLVSFTVVYVGLCDLESLVIVYGWLSGTLSTDSTLGLEPIFWGTHPENIQSVTALGQHRGELCL